MTYTPTPTETLAYTAGQRHAANQITLGVDSSYAISHDPLTDEQDIRDLVFKITGEKHEVEDEISTDIVSAYEDGYFDAWEEHLAYTSA